MLLSVHKNGFILALGVAPDTMHKLHYQDPELLEVCTEISYGS